MKSVLKEIASFWEGKQPVDIRCALEEKHGEASVFTVAVKARKLVSLLKEYKGDENEFFEVLKVDQGCARPCVHVTFKQQNTRYPDKLIQEDWDEMSFAFDEFYDWLNMMLT